MVELKIVLVNTKGGSSEAEDDIVNGGAEAWSQGKKSRFNNFGIHATIAVNINILAKIIHFSGEVRNICISDHLVKLFLRVHGTVELSCHVVPGDSSIVIFI